MSYEMVKVGKISKGKPNKETGEIPFYVEVSVLTQTNFRITDSEALAKFEALSGHECLVPCELAEYEGRAYWRLTGDRMPIPLTAPAAKSSTGPVQSPLPNRAA